MFCKIDNSRRKSCHKGFTLVELTIVVMILGVLAASAAPRIGASITRYRIEAAAKRIVSDLSLARRNAMVTSTNRSVDFFISANKYKLNGINDLDRTGQEYQIRLSDTGYAATLVSADFSGSPSIGFDMYGNPDSGGTVVIQVGSDSRTISVDADSGKATVL